MLSELQNFSPPESLELANAGFERARRSLLARYLTNNDFRTPHERDVFGLKNLPESVKGALFSRYSRSYKSLRRLLLDEFAELSETESSSVEVPPGSSSHVVNDQKAEEFYDRVLIGYGDDSVAELGGAHIACENISQIAALALTDSRIGLSPLEKSTRYVRLGKTGGRYPYYRPPEIMASEFATLYEETLDLLFDTYHRLYEPTWQWVLRQNPIEEGTSDRAYASATKAQTLDVLRGLLPLATLTNVGLFGNGRSFEYLLVKLAANQHPELQSLGSSMQQELDTLIPSFVKRAKSDRGVAYSKYLADTKRRSRRKSQNLLAGFVEAPAVAKPGASLVDYYPHGEEETIGNILYESSDRPLAEVREIATKLSPTERQEIIATYLGDRQSRFHRPGRALEETYYTFDIVADIGAYRDLHRHRIATQERQEFTPKLGYITQGELIAAGVADRYRHCLDVAADTWEAISQDFPESAQYCIPFAYLVRWRMKFNLREAIHLIELRSGRQGHSSYREIAIQMFMSICQIHPLFGSAFKFVDTENYDFNLSRIVAERRLDEKLR